MAFPPFEGLAGTAYVPDQVGSGGFFCHTGLIWVGSENLSVFIAFLVVFPIIYINTMAGFKSTDPKLLEMARVFHMQGKKKLFYIYRPALLPYLISGCRVALGMGWKSGVAAEVIGVPNHSIGEKLYMAKIYLSTADLFAWTLVIIVISALFEKFFLWLLSLADAGLKSHKKTGGMTHGIKGESSVQILWKS
uniref:ABC transporter permease n=1 Tax=Clostridium sp. NkU-1 TaxID=1095009 RepID=UPI003260A51C